MYPVFQLMVRGSGAVLQPLSSSLYSASCRTGQAVPLGATLATMCLFKVEKEEAEALMTMVFPTQSQLFCKLNMEIKLFFPVCVCVCVCVCTSCLCFHGIFCLVRNFEKL
jgi:hypothetical protein